MAALVSTVTCSSFAVLKNDETDCLLSWPRSINAFMDDPPYVDLPFPEFLARLHLPADFKPISFVMDVSNFQNIILPKGSQCYCFSIKYRLVTFLDMRSGNSWNK